MPDEQSGYGASSITVLEGLEAVRKRPGMYIGSTGERGLHHLVSEVVDNAVDEALAGHCDRIVVTLLADGGVRVSDNGRGIPVGLHPKEKRPAVEVVLHDAARRRQVRRRELRRLRRSARRRRGGGQRPVDPARGRGPAGRPRLDARPTCARSPGRWPRASRPTRPAPSVTFWADDSIFTETTTYSRETLHRRLQEMAFLNKGLSITLADERTDEPVESRLPLPGRPARTTSGTSTHSKTAVHAGVIGFTEESSTGMRMTVEVAMQWNDSYSESVYTFANTINTHEGGTHEEGFRAALTKTVQRLGARTEAPQGEGDQPRGLRRPRGPHRDHQPEDRRPAVRGADQDQARQLRGEVVRPARDAASGCATGSTATPARARRSSRRRRQAARARLAARQARDLTRRKGLLESQLAAGQARRLPVDRPARVRAVRRRGRLRRRLGQGRPRLEVPGDPADPRARS